MAKRRVIVWTSVAALAAAGLAAAVPTSRHAVRHWAARHTHIRFGAVSETPVVPVRQELASAGTQDGDLRFVAGTLADARGRLTAPSLDGAAFAAPTQTVRRAGNAAEISGAAIDKTTMGNGATAPSDAGFLADLAGARQAMRHYHEGDLAAGDEFARMTNGPLRVALDWAAIRLQSREAGLARLLAFESDHRDWPMRPWIGRRIEEARAAGNRDTAAVLSLFAGHAPETLAGTLSLAKARLATGDTAGAGALIQGIWRNDDLTAGEEALIQRDFSALIRKEDTKARVDRLLYKENVSDALRLAAQAGPDVVALARARVAVINKAASDAAISAVPKALQNDPGLLFSRIQKARRANRIDEAATLIQSAPRDPAALVDGDEWWVERRLIARKLLDAGNPKLAYAIANVDVGVSQATRIEQAFHAGWIALRFLNDPALAAPHFAAVSKLAETPISNARGAYWQGRTAEAQGHAEEARTFYGEAAELPTTFYGQLAAAKLGRESISLRQPTSPAAGPARSDAVQCVAMLFALGERDLALGLALGIAKNEHDEAQVAALAEVVAGTGDARATLEVGKAAAQHGMPLDEAAFPTFGIPGYQPIEHSADRATVLAIARQESEFDPRSVSAAGAMGLMQLIASTARKTAQDAGIGFDQSRLLTDAAFNARIGAAHLGKLLSDLDGSYILTFAAYNAGAKKVQEWIAAYGDPRKPGVDAVDWIERIPFTETRNYVQRVFENMQIYRAQFGMPKAVLTASQPGDPGKRS